MATAQRSPATTEEDEDYIISPEEQAELEVRFSPPGLERARKLVERGSWGGLQLKLARRTEPVDFDDPNSLMRATDEPARTAKKRKAEEAKNAAAKKTTKEAKAEPTSPQVGDGMFLDAAMNSIADFEKARQAKFAAQAPDLAQVRQRLNQQLAAARASGDENAVADAAAQFEEFGQIEAAHKKASAPVNVGSVIGTSGSVAGKAIVHYGNERYRFDPEPGDDPFAGLGEGMLPRTRMTADTRRDGAIVRGADGNVAFMNDPTGRVPEGPTLEQRRAELQGQRSAFDTPTAMTRGAAPVNIPKFGGPPVQMQAPSFDEEDFSASQPPVSPRRPRSRQVLRQGYEATNAHAARPFTDAF